MLHLLTSYSQNKTEQNNKKVQISVLYIWKLKLNLTVYITPSKTKKGQISKQKEVYQKIKLVLAIKLKLLYTLCEN